MEQKVQNDSIPPLSFRTYILPFILCVVAAELFAYFVGFSLTAYAVVSSPCWFVEFRWTYPSKVYDNLKSPSQIYISFFFLFSNIPEKNKMTLPSHMMLWKRKPKKEELGRVSTSRNDLTCWYLPQGLRMVFSKVSWRIWQMTVFFCYYLLLRFKIQSQLYITKGKFLCLSKYEHMFYASILY